MSNYTMSTNLLEKIIESIGDTENILKADGFDSAVIGIDLNEMKLIYSVSKCIEILSNDMSIDEAVEYFEYNVAGAYVGNHTPIWCYDDF